MHLVNTERCPQQPLDKAACCVLADRSLPCDRASWQQCARCEHWIQDKALEYTFCCALHLTPTGAPTIGFQLETRYPAYICTSCQQTPASPYGASATGNQDVDKDSEQLSPLHVQAVYLLWGSKNKDNMGEVAKGFVFHCPDCACQSQLLQTPAQVKAFIQQHASDNHLCVQTQAAVKSGTYDTTAAFGAANYNSSVEPEKVIKELLSRLVVMTANHIVVSTRPPPTPIEQLKGEEQQAAAATQHLKATYKEPSSSAGQQLAPYRSWALDALSLDSQLLTEANWVRPSLAGMALQNKPSLLDMLLAPPYVAVAEHDAGMMVEKLAVLLRHHKGTSFALLTAAVAPGKQLHEAVAAVEAALLELLATDAVFLQFPQQQRLELFLKMTGILDLSDVAYALAHQQLQTCNPQSIHLEVCAVCGMSAAALKHHNAKRPTALHRCGYCIICTCQTCKHKQERHHPSNKSAAAAQLCLWCQGHPDSKDIVPPVSGSSRVVPGSSKGRSGFQRYTSTADTFPDDEEDVAAGSWKQDVGAEAGLIAQDADLRQQQQRRVKVGGKKERITRSQVGILTAAALKQHLADVATQMDGVYDVDRTADDSSSDLLMQLATAAEEVAGGVGLTTDDSKQRAAVACELYGVHDVDKTADGSSCDLLMQLATAAAAAAGATRLTNDHNHNHTTVAAAAAAAAAAATVAPFPVSVAESQTKLKPCAISDMLDKEVHYIESLQIELQLAAQQLGLQEVNLVSGQQQQVPADALELELHTKRQPSPDTANKRESDTRHHRRLCQQQHHQKLSGLPPEVSDVATKPSDYTHQQ